MATRTMLQKNRAYDHIYDPTYITSHQNDHYRQTSKAMFNAQRIERVPDDKYMFSELPHYPRCTIQVTSKEALPKHVDKDWFSPVEKPVDKAADNVSGPYRHKFFARPNKQMLSTLPHIVQYAMKSSTQRGNALADGTMTMIEPRTKTVGTQSVFRESEAQTDPYSPDYNIEPNQVPEVVALTHLTYGAGLPATEAELQIIERTRQKRLFQQMLPPPCDEFGMEVRVQLMEAQEFREWADREKTIRELQEKRLQLLQQALMERDMNRESAQVDKVERVRQRKEEERDRKLAACQRLRTKVLRKMQKERQNAEAPVKKRDVIAEYADFTSQVYAPLARKGHVPDYNTARIEVQPTDLSSFPGLLQLEQSLHPSVLRATDKHPKEMDKKQKSSHQIRKELEMTTALKTAMESIKKDLQQQPSEGGEAAGKAGDGAGATTSGGLKKFQLRHLVERPDSPRDKNDVLPEEEEQESAVLLLQRLIRGRAFQNLMFEGKEKRLDLINELRAAERFAETATTVEEKRYITQLRDKAFEGVLESVQGSVISQTLDQLSKELLRFQQEKHIAAMVKLAERTRQDRQAMESGRRQAEERLREREDQMFRQVMGVHQGTVDSYLEEVLTNTVEQAAQSRALTEARLKAAKINQVVDTLEAASQDPEVVVRELVHSFNLPHVQREVAQRRAAAENKRFSEAARSALDETYKKVTDNIMQ
eukprot:TRINITY_DN93989_c0_g1_i1.p1 TRINITY_DN93989_c0_g1~~TRINITY_DN93989_c0_g1_i1.p1  ORF type:complete len:707 (-),score=201.34 TRINITY_DN93989_c0_g1_i1:155-2275(-)